MHSQSVNSPATVACPHSSSGGAGPVSLSAAGQQLLSRSQHHHISAGAAGSIVNNGRQQELQKPVPLKVCDWCEKTRKHRIIISNDKIRKSFCSEQCYREWRESYAKCSNCERVIQGQAVTGDAEVIQEAQKDFCSTECLQKFRLKSQKDIQGRKQNNLHPAQVSRSSIATATPAHSLIHSSHRNGTSGAQNSSSINHRPVHSHLNPHSSITMDSSSDVSVSSSSSSSTIPVTPTDQKEKPLVSPAAGKTAGRHRQVTTPSFHYETYGIFDWDSYLKEVGGTPAPDKCFKQSVVPPDVEFMPGMKLEARDPRNSSSTTIASVVYNFGPRLQLRLEGSDNTNDFFELVDSSSIQPIGTCDRKGDMLQPPLGFRRNPSQWPNFMVNALQNAVIAPDSAFKPEPPDPEDNLFEEGMKLEAVDRKNPRLICPATVGAVKDNQIFVTFDGWKGAFDYWCDYRSRELFPVGWCRNAAHPLQPPGNRAPTDHLKAKMMSAGKSSNTLPAAPPLTPSPAAVHQNNNKLVNGSKSHTTQHPQSKQKVVPPLRLERSLIQTPVNGSKVRKDSIDDVKLRARVVDAGQTAAQTVTPKRTKSVAFPPKSSTTQVSYQTPAVSRVSKVLVAEESDTTVSPEQVTAIPEVDGNGDLGHETLKRKRLEDEVPEIVLDTKSPFGSNHRAQGAKSLRLTEEADSPPSACATTPPDQVMRPNHSHKSGGQKSPANLMEWTVDDVITHLVTEDSSLNCSDIFREHEIDGKALLLLNSEMMMKWMNLKLGPALKICYIIERLRSSCKKLQTNHK